MSIVDKSPITLRVLLLTISSIFIMSGAAAQQSYTLRDCIQYGLQNHPAMSIAKNNVDNANQVARESLAGYLPQVNLNGGLDCNLKLQTSIIPASPPLFPTETRLTFGNKFASSIVVQVDQPIYNQSLLTGLQANKPTREIAQLNEAEARQTVIYNIASAYFRVITIQKQLQLLNNNKDRVEKLHEVAKLQLAGGVIKKTDMMQVQVNLNNVLSQISIAENTLQSAINTLKNAMGLYNEAPITLSDTGKWLQYTPKIEVIPSFNYTTTISYKLQEKQVSLYGINARSIRAGSLPVLSGYARYGFNGFGSDMPAVFARQFDYSAVGLKLSWSLFDGFRRNSRYHQAIFQQNNALLNMKINSANTSLQYLNASNQLIQAQNTLNLNKENVDLAAQVYDNATLQYKEGIKSLSDLLNAESSYRDAQNIYIQSLINYYLAQVDLQRLNSTMEEYFSGL